MTSQTENTIDEALKAEAKELGVKGIHFFKTQESLQAKVDSMKVAEPVVEAKVAEAVKSTRAKAPSMSVHNINNDDRADLVARMEAEDPECKYVFQAGTVMDRELKAKGLERTGHEIRNDILCRTTLESYDAVQQAKRDAQFESMQRIDGGQGIIDSFTEVARKPKGG